MSSRFGKYVAALLLVLYAATVFAADPLGKQESATWWDDQKRGWFWYEDPPPEEEKEPSEEEPPVRQTFKDFSYEDVWKMHPEDFQQLYNNTLNAAVQDPSVDNVYGWYQMQDIARRKSLQFANVAQYVVQTNPQLNYQKDSPVAAPGRKALYQQQFQDTENVIRQGMSDHGLLFFFSTSCPYCLKQAGVLEGFTRKYQWDIRPVNISEEPNLAARFGVETVPTVLLVKRDVPQPYPVAVGVIARNEMERNISRGMRLLDGTLNPTEYSLYEFQRGTAADPFPRGLLKNR